MSRLQIEDRMQELGDLYAASAGEGPRSRNEFVRRLAADVRRPGFALLIAEDTTLTGCAYGWRWREGYDAHLPRNLRALALGGGLFAVSGIVVPVRVRTHHQDRDWNLARRLQRRLLDDQDAALGVTLVRRCEPGTLAAFRSWGWQDVPPDPGNARPVPPDPCQVLILGR